MNSKTPRKPFAAATACVAVASFVYACTTPLTPEDVKLRPTTFTSSGSQTMTATVGTTLQNQPAVVVRDQFNEAMPDVTVAFAVSAGTVTPSSKATDSNGQAAPTSWQLPTASGTATLTASIPGSSLAAQTFTVTLNPGPASQAAVAATTPSSNNQSAPAGSAVPVVPQVRVADQYNNPVPGVAVTFAVTAGGGTVVPTTAVQTDNNGVARATSWTLGTALGTNTLRATVAGIATPVLFTATGVAGAPASIVVAPGTPSSQGQSAIAGTRVAVAPSVLVRDANNNPVSGVTTRFTIGGGNGKLIASSTDATGSNTLVVVTNSSGIATVFGWKLGDVGSNTMSVNIPSAASVPAVVFSATGTVGPPKTVTILNQAWATTKYNTVHGGSPSVVVADTVGNPVSNVTIAWTAGNANGTVSGTTTTSTTNPSGVAAFPKASASWTAGASIGTQMQLVATVQGSSPTLSTTFTSTIAGDQSAIAIAAGDNQSAGANSNVATRPAVVVRDASGNPVPGVGVTYTVATGGGAVSATPTGSFVSSVAITTDSVGVARVGAWRLGGTVGTNNNTLQAQLTGLAPAVTFTASATAGAPASVQAKTGNPTSGPANSTIQVTVIVRDGLGNTVSGANVTFAVTGTPTNAAVTSTATVATNTLGEATASWRLDTLARTNTLTATVGTSSVTTTLSATSTALGASRLAIVQGNNQTVPPSTTVGTPPQVRVTDQYNNPVGGVNVTFATAAGSGTVTAAGCSATTSCVQASTAGTGLASVSWTLGSATGTQTLSTFLTETPAVTASFTATAQASNTCTTASYTLGTTVSNGAIATTDCGTGTPATYHDAYQFTTTASTYFSMTMKPVGFEARLKQFFWVNTGFHLYTTAAPPDSIHRYFVVAAGTYQVHAAANVAGATGTYTLSSAVNPTAPSTVCDFSVTKGITHSHNVNAANCLYKSTTDEINTFRSSRGYYILIPAGGSMTITMAGPLDNYIEVYDITGTRTFVSSADVGFAGATETLTVTNSGAATKYYEIRATHYLTSSSDTPKTGTYTLTINP